MIKFVLDQLFLLIPEIELLSVLDNGLVPVRAILGFDTTVPLRVREYGLKFG